MELAQGTDFEHTPTRDLASAQRVMLWASIGAATPFHRQWSLDAIDVSLSLLDSQTQDPERAAMAIEWEQYRYGKCAQSVHVLELKREEAAMLRAAEVCAEPAARLIAARGYLRVGEADKASDALDRYRQQIADRSEVEDLQLAATAYLLAGRARSAAAVLHEMAPRAKAIYVGGNGEAAEHWIECGALALDARAGDPAARAKLETMTFTLDPKLGDPYRTTSRAARGFCGVFLADLVDGDERVGLINKLRVDERMLLPNELDSLLIEAAPANAPPREGGPSYLSVNPIMVLTASVLQVGVDTMEWRALTALASLKEPTSAQRESRMRLAAEAIPAMALLGGEQEAFAWQQMLVDDAKALEGTESDPLGTNVVRVQAMAVALALRFGRPRGPVPAADHRIPSNMVAELNGIIAVVEHGDISLLTKMKEGLFANGPLDDNPYFAGLRIGANGSGEDLAAWLTPRLDLVTLPVAMLTAHRLTSGVDAMRQWVPAPNSASSPFESLARTATRARVAQILELGPLARRNAEIAARLRKGMMRRETSMALHVLRLMGT